MCSCKGWKKKNSVELFSCGLHNMHPMDQRQRAFQFFFACKKVHSFFWGNCYQFDVKQGESGKFFCYVDSYPHFFTHRKLNLVYVVTNSSLCIALGHVLPFRIARNLHRSILLGLGTKQWVTLALQYRTPLLRVTKLWSSFAPVWNSYGRERDRENTSQLSTCLL